MNIEAFFSMLMALLEQPPYWLWVVLGLILMSLEALMPGVFLIWLGIAALIVGGLIGLSPEMTLTTQLFAFAISAAIAVLVALKYFRPKDQTSDQPLLNRRGAQYIGQKFVTNEPIQAGRGRLKIGDSTWSVRGPDCAVGSTVCVVEVGGATLIIEVIAQPATLAK